MTEDMTAIDTHPAHLTGRHSAPRLRSIMWEAWSRVHRKQRGRGQGYARVSSQHPRYRECVLTRMSKSSWASRATRTRRGQGPRRRLNFMLSLSLSGIYALDKRT